MRPPQIRGFGLHLIPVPPLPSSPSSALAVQQHRHRHGPTARNEMTTVSFPRGNKDAWASVSEPASGVFVLSMHNLPDNRLLPVRLDLCHTTSYRSEGADRRFAFARK